MHYVTFTDLNIHYVAAYLLATLGGKTSPSTKDIKSILANVAIDADEERLNKVITELNGKNINDIINSGLSKLSCFPSSGAIEVGAAPPAGSASAPSVTAEEKKEEKKEESDEDTDFGLFN
ncbi:60S acidic ribosomal protein P2-like [Erpetoichthys calabaricus]|uniref:Large ribosomal subunit protein P2 n=1 Tax=Erpetoichthys calabaricus TaxID=27687 RepID=A0A8C4X827_ERPCA|nr:60S acidic ribosomal protein P2-like [Erpetoichthys calabaricus]